MYIIFFVSPVEINEKKMKNKIFSTETVFGLLPKLYGEKKNFVLQPWFCIAREGFEW